MNLLPIELLTKIASYLSYEDRKSFVLVCKRFNKCTYFKELWQNVTYVICKVQIAHLNVCFLNILSSIKLFSVNITPLQLHDIIKYSPNLQELALLICFDLFIDHDAFIKSFSENICDETRNTLAKLRVLNLSGNKDHLTDVCFNCFLSHCTNLEEIDLSELDILNINISWSTLPSSFNNHMSPVENWTFLYYFPSVVPSSKALHFNNIILQLFNIKKSLKVLKVCSTHIEYDEIFMIVTIPQLSLVTICLDHCKGINFRSIQVILQYQFLSIRDISLLNTFPLPLSFINLVISDVPNLRTLKIRGNGKEENISFLKLKDHYLRCLHLENCVINDDFINFVNDATSLVELSLLGCNFRNIQNTCLGLQHLQKLDLSRSYGFLYSDFLSSIFTIKRINILMLNSLQINDNQCSFSSLQHLEVLSLIGCGGLSGVHLAQDLQSLHHLKVLRLQGIGGLNDSFLCSIIHIIKGLIELDLSSSTISTFCLTQCLTAAHKLRKLRLDDSTCVSDVFLKKLQSLCPYLQDVSMRNCDLIEDPIALNFYDRKFLYQLQ